MSEDADRAQSGLCEPSWGHGVRTTSPGIRKGCHPTAGAGITASRVQAPPVLGPAGASGGARHFLPNRSCSHFS